MRTRKYMIAFVLFNLWSLQFGGLMAYQTGTRSQSFAVGSGGNLKVSVDSGDIEIQTSGQRQVLVDVVGLDSRNQEDLQITRTENTVSVDFHPGWGSSRNVRFEIQVPSKFNLDLNTTGGDITISGSLKGRVEGATSGGDISVDDIDEVVEMATSGGDITVGRVGKNASFKTSGGDIEVQDVAGQVEVKTSGGDITIGNVGRSLEAATAGGNIVLGRVGGDAEVSTAGGDIEVAEVSGSASLSTAGGDTTLAGATGMVKASTAGGDLELKNVR